MTLDFKPGDDYYDTYGARVDVIVDKETGLLLQLTQYRERSELLDVNRDDPATSSSIRQRPAATSCCPSGRHEGDPPRLRLHAIHPRRDSAIVGYAPLLPRDTAGRTLVRLAAAKRSQLAPARAAGSGLPRCGHGPLRPGPRRRLLVVDELMCELEPDRDPDQHRHPRLLGEQHPHRRQAILDVRLPAASSTCC